MPHVKGNKFKPKPADPSPADLAAAAAAQIAAPAAPAAQSQQQGSGEGKKKKGKKQRKKQQGGAAAAAGTGDVAVEAAAPAAAASGAAVAGIADDPPPSKKQRREQQAAQVLALAPAAIPTVVAPRPKAGAAPSVAAAAATSNWSALKAVLDVAKKQQAANPPHWQQKRQKRKAAEGKAAGAADVSGVQPAVPANRPDSIGRDTAATKVVAVDCEMVGVGPNGLRSVLARVCVVNSAGNVLLDRFVRPQHKVTDFRTKYSGVRPANLRDAPPFEEVQRQVADLFKGRIVVGHAIENDLEVLLLSHHKKHVRDTSKYPPLMKAQARTGTLKPRALRHLALEQLGLTIQEGEHNPMDDARASLYLYLKHRKEWERWHAAGGRQQDHPAVAKMVAQATAGGFPAAGAGQKKAGIQLSFEQLAKNDYMADL